MIDKTTSPDAGVNIAQELGADTTGQRSSLSDDRILPVSISAAIRELTRAYPFAMLGVAFLAGVAFVGRRSR